MAILQLNSETWVPQHVLLIGTTKLGKTRWCIEALKSGYEMIYVDCDNGMDTIKQQLADKPEILARFHYFAPGNMLGFLADFFTLTTFRWNETRNEFYEGLKSAPTDRLCEIKPGRIPKRILLVLDSWTSLANSALRAQASKLSIDLSEEAKYGRELYGGSGFQVTQIAQYIQTVRFGVIAIAHPMNYERKARPPGTVGTIQEKDMRILETIQVPVSTSGPHGWTLGKFFNQIGNLSVNNMKERELTFELDPFKISGGTPKGKGNPLKEFSFANLFGNPPPKAEDEPQWIRYLTAEELKAEVDAAKPAAPVQPKKLIQTPAATIGSTPGLKVSGLKAGVGPGTG